MNLFLCSRFCIVGTLIKENLQNKRIAFIPTAAAKEGASRYVLAGRELLSEMGAIVTEIDIYCAALCILRNLCADGRFVATGLYVHVDDLHQYLRRRKAF